MTKKRKITIAVTGILMAIAVFFLGFGVSRWTLSKKVKTVSFLIDKIDSEYTKYDEETGKYISFTAEDYADAIVNGLLDRYSEYYTPSEYSEVISSSKGNTKGVGIRFYASGSAEIADVIGNSPAEKAGLKAGHIISAIEYDGETTDVTDYMSAYNALTIIPQDEEFKIFVNGVTQPFNVKKESFVASYVYYRDNEVGFNFWADGNKTPIITETNENMPELPENVAFVKLSEFNGKAAEQFGEAYQKIFERERDTLILDLRNNGGGYLDILEKIASYLAGNGKKGVKVAVAKYKNGAEEVFKTTLNISGYNALTKIVVLANENTASASECLIGAMVSHGKLSADTLIIENSKSYLLNRLEDTEGLSEAEREALITSLPTRTYGKGIMQTTLINLFNGFEALKLTNAYIFWPNGTTIHGKGATTSGDNAIIKSETFDVDNALNRAIDLLG